MPYCPKCGSEVKEGAKFCGNCGYQLTSGGETASAAPAAHTPTGERPNAISALQEGWKIISAKPAVLLPAVIGAAISAVLSFIAAVLFVPFRFETVPFLTSALIAAVIAGGILSLIGGIISYILGFASLEMSRDAYLGKELNLSESISYVLSRIWTFIVASIVGAILAITIILIPVVILMFVIMVVDEAGLSASLSRALKVVGSRLGDILILIVIGIIGNAILNAIPFFGFLLAAAFNVLIALAYIDVYFHYKTATATNA